MRVVSSDLHCFIVSTILDVCVGWSGLSELCPIWKTLFYTKLPRPHLCGGGKMEVEGTRKTGRFQFVVILSNVGAEAAYF